MRDAMRDGSYWSDQSLQDRVRASLATGSEQAAGLVPAIVPAGAPSSLSSAAAADKQQLEAWMADKSSPYWRGDDNMSAEAIQGLYRDILEAEARGEDTPTGASYRGADADTPSKRTGYNYEGLAIHDGATRDLVDEFASHAIDAGFGNERVRDVLHWALSQPAGVTERQFRSWALQRGWSSTHVRYALEAYRDMKKRR